MSEATMVKVSVIVPVHNVEKYLAKCIKSIIDQTLKSIEIICVDDGSTDGSWGIIQDFAERDSRIIALQQKNSGPAAARNKGLEVATGEYVGFVDADDYVDKDYFKILYTHAKDRKADIVRGYVKNEFDSNDPSVRMISDASATESFYNVTSKDAVKRSKLYLRGVVWLAIYKRSLLERHDITFPSGIHSGEDVLFNLSASYYANKVDYADKETFYHYTVRKNSIVNDYSYTKGGVLSKALVVSNNTKFMNTKPDYDRSVYVERMMVALHAVNKSLASMASLDKNTEEQLAGILLPSWRKMRYKQEVKASLQGADADFTESLKSKKQFNYYINSVLPLHRMQHDEKAAQEESNAIKVRHGMSRRNLLKRLIKALVPYGAIVIYRNVRPRIVGKVSGYRTKVFQDKLQKNRFDELRKRARKIPADDNPEIVVSLTTYGKRIEQTAPVAVASILSQTVLPDKVVLWLGHGEKPSRALKKLTKYGLEIGYTKDLRAYTKLLPTLSRYPSSAIITVDDDIAYPDTWLEKTIKTYRENPDSIIVNRARKIMVSKGVPESYWQWPIMTENSKDYHVIFPTGVGGVLYPPDTFKDKAMFDEELFMSLSPGNDDVWFWAMSQLSGRKRVIVSNGFSDTEGCELGTSTVDGLFKTTNSGDRNDVQFTNVLNRFPILKKSIGIQKQ